VIVTREDELELCEAFGRLFESTGNTRIAGRLAGWLLICEPPEQTAARLVEVLGISKASVSTELRWLEQLGVVERTTIPGDRRSYWRIGTQAWPELMERRLRLIDRFVELADQGLALLEHEPTARRTRLSAMRRVHGQLQRSMQGVLAELRREAESPTPEPAARPRPCKPKQARKR
jgi:DNA-binding transcriptional regulator GbsR (MarR family)